MNNFNNEFIGYESLLPKDIVEFLNNYKTNRNKNQQCYFKSNNGLTSILDEHEIAMAE